MLKTIEAKMENGKIIPLQKIPNKKWAKILITLLEEEEIDNKKGMTFSELMAFSGALKDLKCKDSVAYQRKIRDEW